MFIQWVCLFLIFLAFRLCTRRLWFNRPFLGTNRGGGNSVRIHGLLLDRRHTEALDEGSHQLQHKFLVLHVGRIETEPHRDRIERVEHVSATFLCVLLNGGKKNNT